MSLTDVTDSSRLLLVRLLMKLNIMPFRIPCMLNQRQLIIRLIIVVEQTANQTGKLI